MKKFDLFFESNSGAANAGYIFWFQAEILLLQGNLLLQCLLQEGRYHADTLTMLFIERSVGEKSSTDFPWRDTVPFRMDKDGLPGAKLETTGRGCL